MMLIHLSWGFLCVCLHFCFYVFVVGLGGKLLKIFFKMMFGCVKQYFFMVLLCPKPDIIVVIQVYEKKPLKIKNFGVWLRYNSRSGTHNMYREYRDLTAAKAVTACCK